ncbi:MAG: DUF929 family protein [Ktedonobacteraceae bacterium]|nr:DUF929 family protein [Ktedonobacteraceae bacterium]
MAKSKQRASQRREQHKQQRFSGNQASQAQARKHGSSGQNRGYKVRSKRRPWLLVVGTLVVIAAIVGIFLYVSHQSTSNTAVQTPVATDRTVLKAVTGVDPSVANTVGTGGVTNLLHAVNGSPPVLKGPTGKPEFFYAGADYCPYCAAQRWAIVVSLSRFGTFSKLPQIQSAESNISTFTFDGSTYSSTYIDFVPLETASNQPDGSGSYLPLQKPTAEQLQLINTYNGPPYTQSQGSIPFIDIANRYVMTGASVDPQKLGSSSWQDIANNLSNKDDPITQAILGSANYLTAAICISTNQQPGSVCNTPVIQQIEKTLGKTAVASTAPQTGLIPRNGEAIVRRQESIG